MSSPTPTVVRSLARRARLAGKGMIDVPVARASPTAPAMVSQYETVILAPASQNNIGLKITAPVPGIS